MTGSPASFPILLLLALLAGFVTPVGAQTPGTTAVVATPPQPAWQELDQTQQQILAPLAEDWNRMENYRRKKWLGIAARYPRMAEQEQERVQRRMREWADMTPEQRKEVREKYKNIKQLPPERKNAVKQKWQEYANLSEEQRLQLKEAGAARPRQAAPQGIGKAFTTLPLRTLAPLSLRPAPAPPPPPPPPPAQPNRKRVLRQGRHTPIAPPPQILRIPGDGQIPSLLPPMPKRAPAPSRKP